MKENGEKIISVEGCDCALPLLLNENRHMPWCSVYIRNKWIIKYTVFTNSDGTKTIVEVK